MATVTASDDVAADGVRWVLPLRRMMDIDEVEGEEETDLWDGEREEWR